MEPITLDELEELKEEASGISTRRRISISGSDIDREVAEEEPCTECGGKLEYDCVIDDDSCRAFSVCKACRLAWEF